VRAAFSKRGRALLVATTAPGHGNRRARPGTSASRLRRAYPRRRSLGRGLYRASPNSRRLIGVRRGRVRYFAVANRRLLRRPRMRSAYLRYAGVASKPRQRTRRR
jgi:hypothetical protein